MTLVVTIKVRDGIAVASDSQRTQIGPSGEIGDVNYDARKIFELSPGLPIGAAVWGAYKLGDTQVPVLFEELQKRFSGKDKSYSEWEILSEDYKLKEIAQRVREFFYEEKYMPAYSDSESLFPSFVIQVFGYSAGEMLPEIYSICIEGKTGNIDGPILLVEKEETRFVWGGDKGDRGAIAILNRLIDEGFLPGDDHSNMSLPRAVQLAELIVNRTIEFSMKWSEYPTIGGKVVLAEISKARGFKWYRKLELILGQQEASSEEFILRQP